MNHLTNHVIVVTGAASGIGRQVAIQAAERGGYVIATDVNAVGLAETLQMSGGERVETQILDVSRPESIVAFAEKTTLSLQGRPLVLINNAGVALDSGNFDTTSLEDFEWLLNINLWGVIRMTKAFLPYFLQTNQGHIVNISSVFGLAGIMGQSAYCTAKFGVRGFTETLRMELYDTKIATTVVHPGGIKTNIAHNARAGGAIDEQTHQKNAELFISELTITTAAEAARQILEAVRLKKAKLVIGKDGKQIDFLTRLLPVRYTKIFLKQLTKAMQKEV